jgi:hypothetical protein
MAGKTAEMAMRPLQDVFMLERETELNMGTLKNIIATGHSERYQISMPCVQRHTEGHRGTQRHTEAYRVMWSRCRTEMDVVAYSMDTKVVRTRHGYSHGYRHGYM